MTEDDYSFLKDISRKAGSAIMKVRQEGDFSVEAKADNSPLTVADRQSHDIIVPALKERFSDIPVISEEDKASIEFAVRKDWKRFWLVDPLDGTKEFIRREMDFTVNIALVESGCPVLGVVYAPARDWLYFGTLSGGAYCEKDGDRLSLPCAAAHEGVVAVRSKSHAKPEEEDVLSLFGADGAVSMGSSLKFCLVAEGEADVYYRAGPTWEWDTAAAHAVVLASGGKVYGENWKAGEELVYNKPSLKNDYGFLCLPAGRCLP